MGWPRQARRAPTDIQNRRSPTPNTKRKHATAGSPMAQEQEDGERQAIGNLTDPRLPLPQMGTEGTDFASFVTSLVACRLLALHLAYLLACSSRF